MSEDDIFRILRRRPLSEIYPIIAKKINYGTPLRKVEKLASEYGYSLEEFFDYDEEYVKRKNTPNGTGR
jgi:hypothetical protein